MIWNHRVELIWDNNFKRSYKKKIANNPVLKKKFIDKIKLFSEDPYNNTLETHKLKGKLKELSAFSVDDNIRVIFKKLEENVYMLIDIGTHDEVY